MPKCAQDQRMHACAHTRTRPHPPIHPPTHTVPHTHTHTHTHTTHTPTTSDCSVFTPNPSPGLCTPNGDIVWVCACGAAGVVLLTRTHPAHPRITPPPPPPPPPSHTHTHTRSTHLRPLTAQPSPPTPLPDSAPPTATQSGSVSVAGPGVLCSSHERTHPPTH